MRGVQTIQRALRAAAMAGLLVPMLQPAALADDDEEGEGGEELEEVVQEVFLGAVAFPQEASELQISVASSWMNTEEADILRPLLVAEWGFTDRLQLEVETPFLIAVPGEGETDGGLGNAEVGLAYNLVRSTEMGLVLTGGLAAILPTSSTDLIERSVGGAAVVSLYKIAGPVHANLSVESGVEAPTEGEGEAEFGVETALSLLIPLGSLIPIAEVGIEREEETEVMAAAGFAWHASSSVEVGLAGLMSRGEEETEWGAVANLTWERNLGGEVD
jgi:hypothetical protein